MGPGNLPASYDAWRTRTPYDDEPDHLTDCPMHEDQPDGDDCACPTQDELKADAAEARADAARED